MKKIIIAFVGIGILASFNASANQISELHERVDETWDKVVSVQDEAREMNAYTSDRVTEVQNTLYKEGVLRAESDRIVASNAQKKLDKVVSTQKKVDMAQDMRISELDGKIGGLNNKINKMDKRLKGGIANATAMASLVAPAYAGSNHMAVGVGGFDGANSVAMGYTRHITENISAKLTFAYGSESELSYGASVGVSW